MANSRLWLTDCRFHFAPNYMDMMRESIMQTKEPFAVKRMLEEYYELLYKFEA